MVFTLFGREFTLIYLISQLFALAALIFNLYAFQRSKKVHLLNYSTVAVFCAIIHYVLLGAWAGAASKTVSTVRNATAAYEASKGKTSKVLPLIFVTFYVVAGIISFDSPLALLPIISSVIYTVTIYISNITIIRYVAILTASLWLIYNICIVSLVGIIAETIFIFDDAIAIYRYHRQGKRHCAGPKQSKSRRVGTNSRHQSSRTRPSTKSRP